MHSRLEPFAEQNGFARFDGGENKLGTFDRVLRAGDGFDLHAVACTKIFGERIAIGLGRAEDCRRAHPARRLHRLKLRPRLDAGPKQGNMKLAGSRHQPRRDCTRRAGAQCREILRIQDGEQFAAFHRIKMDLIAEPDAGTRFIALNPIQPDVGMATGPTRSQPLPTLIFVRGGKIIVPSASSRKAASIAEIASVIVTEAITSS